jgi:hypothetical protein
MRRTIVALALLPLLLMTTPASAARVIDPQDSLGHRLDLRVFAVHRQPNGATKVVLITYGEWRDRTVSQATHNRLFVLMDLNGDGRLDCRGYVSANGTNGLYFATQGAGCADGPFGVNHPNPHKAGILIPAGSPANPAHVWFAAGASRLATAHPPCASVCRDRAPDSGWLTVSASP